MPEDKKINPQITTVDIGKRDLRTITIYPLSLGDQEKLTDIIVGSLADVPDSEIGFISFAVGILKDNIRIILELIADGEKADDLMKEITMAQAIEIAEMVYTINYESLTKKVKGLFENMKATFPLKRPLSTSVNDTPDTELSTSTEEDSKTEE